MKIFTQLIISSLCLIFAVSISSAQDTIVIPGGIENIGLVETTINGDTIADGERANPQRVYMLQKDQIYFMESRIQFGGDNVNDTTSTLIIVGEEGGNLPAVLSVPKDGGDAFNHLVHGSLTLKNVYWPATTTTGKSAPLFHLFRSNQTLRVEGVVTEMCQNGDLFGLRDVRGRASVFLKNCYFRDNSQMANSWNFAVFARGDNGEAVDTIWIENCTVSNSGLTFFGKSNPVKFLFFDHNTIVNTPKYVFFMEQYNEAYFTNNLFVNCNWEGECQSTYETQLQSQIAGLGGPAGITNVMPIVADLWELGHGFVPEMEDVKWMSSNNVHYTSPFLDRYYNGEFNDVGDYPISNRAWSADIEETDLPIPVENVPPRFLSEVTEGLVAQYDGIVEDNNYDNTLDPGMRTKGIASQEVGDEMAKWGRNNYGVANDGETFDRAMFAFGDLDPTTIPGPGTENGAGFANVRDLVEDFSYDNTTRSEIDSRPFGSLAWWDGELDTYDGIEALENVKAHYDALVMPSAAEDLAELPEAYNLSNFPNPVSSSTVISFTLEQSSKVSLTIYDASGRAMEVLLNQDLHSGVHNVEWDASDFAPGTYLYRIAIDNLATTKKLVVLK